MSQKSLSTKEYHEISFRQSRIHYEFMKSNWGFDFISPIEQELRKRKDFKVLNVECGPGIWLSQLSKDYPSAKFVGTGDLPTNFPKDFSQNNLQFIQSNILEGLPFEDDSFDFVYTELVADGDWDKGIANELIRVCKPGGWVEILGIDDMKSFGPTSERLAGFTKNCVGSRHEFGEKQIDEFLYATNRIDKVCEDERLIPIGNWAGNSGTLALEYFSTIFNLTLNNHCEELSKDEYENMLKQFVKESERYRSYVISYRMYCQKTVINNH